jgi:phosphoglycerol transferase MdoB-like AlkP superfamily enzyme
MSSLAGILTGLPDVGVFTAYRPSARRPFPSSPAAIFKRLDYRTRLFYSGYLSWQRIGDFCSDQGFDEVYGGGAIDAGASGNEWGADDEHLFAFVERNCPDDIPSFNVVLTTSNHPPFNVDVYGQGFPLRAIPAGLDADDNGSCPLLVLGHLWYSDRCVGRFIHAITAKLPRALVALTGDHWSRRCLNVRQSLFDKSAVPLLLYGPAVLDGVTAPARPFGGQLDIATTLIELSAPAGFAYHALGESVLTPERHVALGPTRVIGSDFLAVFSSPPVVVPLPGLPPPTTPPDLEALKRRYDALCGLAWWRIMRGNDLPPPR